MKRHYGIINTIMRNHNVVFLIVGLLILLGIFSIIYINKDEYPLFTIRQGVIVGVFPGATSQQVEVQLTRPLEKFLFTYPEVDKAKTYSYSQNGMAYIFVELNKNVHNKNEAWSKIRHGLKDFKLQLPSSVLAIVVQDDFGNTSSLLIALEANDKTQREMEHYADNLSDRLRSIAAMGNIKIIGTLSEEISIWVEQEKLAMYGINSQMLFTNLYAQNLTTMGGHIENFDFTQPLHVKSPLRSEKELEEQIIYSDPTGNIVRLRDIARIERHYASPSNFVKKDGHNAIVISIEMRAGNNIVAFGEEVEDVLKSFQETLPESVKITRISDQPKVVGDSVWSFLRDLVLAIFIVIGVMLMLFPLQSALVAGSGIPVCTAITLAIMLVFNMELNTVTLAALITVLGMMVDNSIVMIDGYIDRINHGMSRWNAAISSVKELFSPLLLATTAICGMFFPIKYILTGPMQDFIKLFPWTIAISLFISLIYAVLVVPYLEFSFIKRKQNQQKSNLVERGQNVFFEKLQSGYEWVLRLCFRHPYLTLLTAIASIAIGALMFLSLNIQMMPKAERPCFAVEIYLPMGSTLNKTTIISDSMQQILSADKRVKSVTTFVGSSSPRFQATYAPNIPGSNYAQMIVNTISNKATEEIVSEYTKKYSTYFPEAYVRFKQIDYQAVSNPVEVRIAGDSLMQLHAVADSILAYMRQYSEYFIWPHTNSDGILHGVNIELKPDEATRLGVTKGTLSLHLATAFDGQPLITFWENDYAIPIKLYTDRADNTLNYESIENQFVLTSFGTWIPLRQIANVTSDQQLARIVHRNGIRSITVGADLPNGMSQPVSMKKLKNFIEKQIRPNLPENITISYGGLTEVNKELIPELALGVGAAIAVIFLFLLFNFMKIDIALLSLGACTLCFFGAFLGLWIFDVDFGMTAVLGLVSLIGIIVRNAIIMFEYAEDLRMNQRKSAYEAAFESGKRRMRPIFLTSATTALGVLPMIISGSGLWMPMGIVICFGTIFSILFIVTVLPVAYWQIYKKSNLKISKPTPVDVASK